MYIARWHTNPVAILLANVKDELHHLRPKGAKGRRNETGVVKAVGRAHASSLSRLP